MTYDAFMRLLSQLETNSALAVYSQQDRDPAEKQQQYVDAKNEARRRLDTWARLVFTCGPEVL